VLEVQPVIFGIFGYFRRWHRPTIIYCPVWSQTRILLLRCVKSLLLLWQPRSWF